MYGNPFQNGVVFLQLHTVRGILPVLLGDVPACPRHATGFVFRALEDDLEPVAFAFLGHDAVRLELDARVNPLGIEFLHVSVQPEFVDCAQGLGADLQRHKFAQLRDKNPFLLNIGNEAPFGFPVGVGNVIS